MATAILDRLLHHAVAEDHHLRGASPWAAAGPAGGCGCACRMR
ncbi:hypothetical protein [Streptomyces sp. NPDC127100]